MSEDSRRIGWPAAAGVAVAAIVVGIGIGAMVGRRMPSSAPTPATASATTGEADPHAGHAMTAPASAEAEDDGSLVLTPDMISRAGITTVVVASGVTSGKLRLPATVQPNGYNEVTVTSFVPGRVTAVRAELGQFVKQGQSLVSLYSPELAEAQATYLGSAAELGAQDQRVARAARLVEIGAVSKQELEDAQAARTRVRAAADSAKARLQLLGMDPRAVDALRDTPNVVASVEVPAPMSGQITERGANPGLNIDTSTPLFTIVDMSNVWVVANVFERDLGRIKLRMPATITTQAYADMALTGTISYLSPQVQPETRTAEIRIEVPNRNGQLRFGMFVDVDVDTGSTDAGILIPRTAVQTRGDSQVVYVQHASERGKFVERSVHLGEASGDSIQVLHGLEPGEQVVTTGAFYLRSERERTSTATPPGADHVH
jgi:membrane fusion protein, heavy metal efflux system